MKFFINEEERKASKSTWYFEFQKGEYDNRCWKIDSINISEGVWNEYELSDLFKKAIPDFDYYGVTRVSLKQWKKILKICVNKRHKSVCVINDMKDWVNECFKSFDCFTICGL